MKYAAFFFASFFFCYPVVCQNLKGNGLPWTTDSLKWKMYTILQNVKMNEVKEIEIDWEKLNFSLEAFNKFLENQPVNDSIFNALDLEIIITDTISRSDTIEYLFDFTKRRMSWRFIQSNTCDGFVGIGYLKEKEIYYPIFGQSAVIIEADFYPKYFLEQEKAFALYIKKHKGDLNSWLKKEAIRRKIL